MIGVVRVGRVVGEAFGGSGGGKCGSSQVLIQISTLAVVKRNDYVRSSRTLISCN